MQLLTKTLADRPGSFAGQNAVVVRLALCHTERQ